MTPIALTARQRAELEGAVVRTPSVKECCRAQALLRLAEGESVEGVADLLHVSRQTVYNWVSRFWELAGLGLRDRLSDAQRPGRPRTGGGVIDPLVAEVIDSDPRDLGYHSTVWTAPLLSRYLQEHHQIAVCDRTVSRPDTWRQSKGAETRPGRSRPYRTADARRDGHHGDAPAA